MEEYILVEKGVLVLLHNNLRRICYDGVPMKQIFTKEEIKSITISDNFYLYELRQVDKSKL